MSIVIVLEIPGATTDQYDRVNELMGFTARITSPTGLISHVCAVTDEGLLICDVWRSQEELDDFVQSRVGPAMQEIGAREPIARFGRLHYQLGTR
jgi:hypothetical protein